MHESFEWDEEKNQDNQAKHGVAFEEAQEVFADPDALIFKDSLHSTAEERWFCVGAVRGNIVTVRFTYREDKIRIFGAGYWRKLRSKYLHKKGTR